MEICEPRPEPPKRLKRRSQARRRPFLPSLTSDFSHRDEEDDPEAMSLGGSSGIPLYTERGVILSHDVQLVALGPRIRELESQLSKAEQGRLSAVMERAEMGRHLETLERRMAETDQHMREAIIVLAVAFPPPSS